MRSDRTVRHDKAGQREVALGAPIPSVQFGRQKASGGGGVTQHPLTWTVCNVHSDAASTSTSACAVRTKINSHVVLGTLT